MVSRRVRMAATLRAQAPGAMKRFMLCWVVFAGTALPATADIISVTGDFAVFNPATASYLADPYNDPAQAPIHIWTEQTAIILGANVLLDTDLANPALSYVTGAAGAGEVVFSSGGGPTLLAGSQVNVYYAYFDPFLLEEARGTVTFDGPVLGIVAYTERLQFSDFLRVPGAPYPGNPAFVARGWEDTEFGQLSADRLTFTFSADASSPGDQFRIFTSVSQPVPEPASLSLLGLGLAVLGARRWRQRHNS